MINVNEGLLLVAIFAGICWAVIHRQRFTPWIGLCGIVIFGYVVLALLFGDKFVFLFWWLLRWPLFLVRAV